MLDRIKTIITASWTTAVQQTEKNACEIFDSNINSMNGNTFFFQPVYYNLFDGSNEFFFRIA